MTKVDKPLPDYACFIEELDPFYHFLLDFVIPAIVDPSVTVTFQVD